MNPDERLADIVRALDSAGLSCLIMGGHAVRHYGLLRYTNDFDFTLAPDAWNALTDRLARSGLFGNAGPVEGNSWRPVAFRRFLLGNLPDGREEWLEFWRENHLLAPFPELLARSEVRRTAKCRFCFCRLRILFGARKPNGRKTGMISPTWRNFSMPGFIANTPPERSHSWMRWLGSEAAAGSTDTWPRMRSMTGPPSARLSRSWNPVTQAFLLPWDREAVVPPPTVVIEPLIEQKLRSVSPASPLHRSLVEVVRRQYKVVCQDLDRADKEAISKAGRNG